MKRDELEEHLATLHSFGYASMKSEDAIRAEYLRLTAVERAAVAQSEEVQRDWLSPVEAHALRAEVERLREALEWYADPAHYDSGKPGELRGLLDTVPTVQYWKADNGQRARAALEPRP